MSITIIFSSDKNSFKKHISYLSSDDLKGRYPGTIGDSLASDYIYNFNSTINTKTYNQYFDYLSFINRTGKISFITDSTTKEYKIGIDFITDLKSSSKKLQAEIVFVGFGRTENGYNDFKNIDIKNKIVFYFISPLPSFSKEKKKIWAKGFSKKKFYEKIYRDGALGIIYIAPKHNSKHIRTAFKKIFQ